MKKKYYAIVGCWGYDQEEAMGITTYEYDMESGELNLIETIRPDIVSGSVIVDPVRKVVFISDEIGHVKGDLGGGGYVRSFRIDPDTGKLTLLSEQRTLSTEPCYMCLDSTGNYLLIAHCADPFHVTKIRQLSDGSYTSETVYDDTALVMVKIKEDGSLGDICDVAVTEGCGATGPDSKIFIHPVSGHTMMLQVISRQRCVARNECGSLYAVTDRGMDKVYSFKVDRDDEKLTRVNEMEVEIGTSPRFLTFHPTMPYVFMNYEQIPYVDSYRYDSESGKLERISHVKAVFEMDHVRSGCSALLLHPNGKILYNTCYPEMISVFSIMENGSLALKQTIKCGGESPHALCISPDGRFLFSGNNHTHTITSFRIDEEGLLTSTERVYEAILPATMSIFTLEGEDQK